MADRVRQLSLDEAYSIVEGGGDKFGREVIRTLLTEIEQNKGNFLVIMAGYKGKMEAFLDHPSRRSQASLCKAHPLG